MSVSALIVAGGTGSRMQSIIPKQFMLLNGIPVLMHTIKRLSHFVTEIIVVLPESQMNYWQELCAKYNFQITHTTTQGGATRFESVKNGLTHIGQTDIVLVHDGVRPFPDDTLIKEVIETAQNSGAAIPVTEVVDSLRQVDGEDSSKIVDRSIFRAVQTPQAFQRDVIIKAYQQPFSTTFTDDASVVQSAGYTIRLTKGATCNIKITTQIDLEFANYIINNQ